MAAKKKNNTANTTKPVKTVINYVEKIVKLTAKPTVENFEKVAGVSLEQVVGAVHVADYKLKFCENAILVNKYNFEAIIEANMFFTQGLQNLSQVLMLSFQTPVEESTSASTKLFACKNVLDVFSTHKELVEASYSKAMEQSKKITDLSVKLGQDASVLISKRLNAAVETLSNQLPA
jgi:phasin family protein